jgi:novel protein kinase C delta type
VNCHKKCEKFIPNLCGVNQKILAEHLKDIKELSSSKQAVTTPKSEVGSFKD